ncbi:MAG TPA: hypothetical protein DIW43_05525, partial [Spongiibacteraceae bacterium]|nr:hypothetical protein [Spongiibacteraceae bacterium]
YVYGPTKLYIGRCISACVVKIKDSQGVELIDCQVGNPHLYSMGAEDITRREFSRLLDALVNSDPAIRGRWALE